MWNDFASKEPKEKFYGWNLDWAYNKYYEKQWILISEPYVLKMKYLYMHNTRYCNIS